MYDNDINTYCCLQHSKMLCEKIQLVNPENNIYFNMTENSIKKEIIENNINLISSPNLIYKTSPLLNILEIIFTHNKIIAIDQLKSIIPFLACELSPCIQKSLLLIFLKIFSAEYLAQSLSFQQNNVNFNNNNNTNFINNFSYNNTETNIASFNYNMNNNIFNNYDDLNVIKKDPNYFIDDTIRAKYISIFLKNKGLEHILAICSISTLDVRIECVKIFNIFSKLSSILPYNIEEQLIPFIANIIFPLKTPLNENNSITNENINLLHKISSPEIRHLTPNTNINMNNTNGRNGDIYNNFANNMNAENNKDNLNNLSSDKLNINMELKIDNKGNNSSNMKWILSDIGTDNNPNYLLSNSEDSSSSEKKSLANIMGVGENKSNDLNTKKNACEITPVLRIDRSSDPNIERLNENLYSQKEFDVFEENKTTNNDNNANYNIQNTNEIKKNNNFKPNFELERNFLNSNNVTETEMSGNCAFSPVPKARKLLADNKTFLVIPSNNGTNNNNFTENSSNDKNTRLSPYNNNYNKQSENLIPKNSLYVLEDEYFRLIIESSFISSLKIPVNYVKNYSNEINDFYLEKLYDYLIKWLVDRFQDEEPNFINYNYTTYLPTNYNNANTHNTFYSNSNNSVNDNYNYMSTKYLNSLRTEYSEDIHLDDSDIIKYRYTLNIIMKVVMNANILNKQKCLVDLYMLSIYNKDNSVILLKNKYFYQWLLDLLLPYQILIVNEKFKHSKESGIAFTILDLGAKIHTSMIINSILNDKNYENEPYIFKCFNFILTWMYKIKTLGQIESDAAGQLLRNIFSHLIKTMADHLSLMSPSVKTPMWHYFLHLTFVVYEFIFYSNFYKKILDKKIIFDHLEKNEILAEMIQNLNYDLNQEKSEVRHSYGNVSMMDLWLDKDLLICLFERYKVIWNQIHLKVTITEKQSFFNFININLNKNSNPSASNKNLINTNISSFPNPVNSDDNNKYNNSNNNNNNNHTFNFTFNSEEIKSLETKINKFIFETQANYYIEDLKLFMFHSNITGNLQSGKFIKNNIMRILLNVIIILIMLSESYDEVEKWVDQLEKLISFAIIASENSRLENPTSQNITEEFLLNQQEFFAEILIIVFYYLIDEINSPRRKKISDKIINRLINSLKFIFVNICLIIEKIDLMNKELAKKKESVLSTYIKTFTNTFTSLFISNGKSLKFYSPSYKLYSEYLINLSKNKLFELEDIQKWKANGFQGLIDLFNEENWIFAFQENNISFEIIKNQFQFNLYEKIINFKLLEAQDIVINNEIGIKEKSYINQLYRIISNSIRESLIYVENFLKNEAFKVFFNKKKREYSCYKIHKKLFLFKGSWSSFNYDENTIENFDIYANYNNSNSSYLNSPSKNISPSRRISSPFYYKSKLSNHITAALSRNVLYPIFNFDQYLPNFNKYSPLNLFLDEKSNKQINQTKILNFGIFNDFSKYENISSEENSFENQTGDNKNDINPIKTIPNEKAKDLVVAGKDEAKPGFSEISILKVKQVTNKSNIFYKNSQFSDFIDKYIHIEKLVKYFKIILEKDFKLIIIDLTEFYIEKIKKKYPESFVFDVCLVKVSGHKKGKLVINRDEVIFINIHYDHFQINNNSNEKCVESLFKKKIKKGQKFFIKTTVKNIKQIYKRRFYYKNNSLEIFLFSNKSHFFQFESEMDRDYFCKLAYEHCSEYKSNTFLFEFYLDIKKNSLVLNKLIEEWAIYGISNFELLMNLNNMSGRSFNDLTQYPVFPWIISNYKTENLSLKNITNNNFEEYLRDLSHPIGALGSEDRKETFQQNFKESCTSYENYLNNINSNPKTIEFNDGKYFYNSHYSNPFYVTNYLARIFPFTYCAIELQGEGFDNPNRQFLSIPKAFENCMSQSTDLRELTPEFFYLPEFLLNKNKINFGKVTECGNINLAGMINNKKNNFNINISQEPDQRLITASEVNANNDCEDNSDSNFNFLDNSNPQRDLFIDNVEIPAWSKDASYFVYMNKIILESQFVSDKINNWIDLVYGSKQKGKEAENSMNLFWNYTYENEIDIDHIKENNMEEYLSYMSKVEFGQTPTQLFKTPIIQRPKKDLIKNNKIFLENKKSMKVFKSTSESNSHFRNRKETVKKMIIKIKSLENNKLICVYNNGVVRISK